MNQATLTDVTIELKQANTSLERIDDNIILANEFLDLTIDTFKNGFNELLKFFSGNSLANIEKQREQDEFNKDLLSALRDLKPKYTGPDEKKKPEEIEDLGLSRLLTGLAAAIGGVIGVIKGQLMAIKAFAKALLPENWLASIRRTIASFTAGISMQLDLVKMAIMDKMSKAAKFITGTFDDVMKFFSGDSKIFAGIKKAFSAIIEPFRIAYDAIKSLSTGTFSKIGEWFSGIAKTLSNFGSMIGRIVGIIGKIFAPIAVILAVWDTVKESIAGFQKEGIIGGIAGAIKGFFNSLIFAPIDMIKDATAWVLGFFGFDKAKEFLKSFSLEDTFSSVIDAIFSPIETVKKILNGVIDFFANVGMKLTEFIANFEIPGFTILGKQFGPWKPFSGLSNDSNPPAGSMTAAAATTPDRTAASTQSGGGRISSSQSTQSQSPPIVLGQGDTSDTLNVNGRSVVYRYSRNQPYVWTPEDIKQKVIALEKGQEVKIGVSFIPQDEAHRNPLVRKSANLTSTTTPPATREVQTAQAPTATSLTPTSTSLATPATQEVQTAQAPTTGGLPGIGAVPSAAVTTSQYQIAGEPFTPGQPLSEKQMTVVDIGLSMGNTYAPEIMKQYQLQKAQLVARPTQLGMAVQSGQQLQTAATENGILQSSPARRPTEGNNFGGMQQNNSTTVVNNSTVVVKPIPAATRRPNNSEDIFFIGSNKSYGYT